MVSRLEFTSMKFILFLLVLLNDFCFFCFFRYDESFRLAAVPEDNPYVQFSRQHYPMLRCVIEKTGDLSFDMDWWQSCLFFLLSSSKYLVTVCAMSEFFKEKVSIFLGVHNSESEIFAPLPPTPPPQKIWPKIFSGRGQKIFFSTLKSD